ncbi:serine/threonine-protein phosphatase 6 regulatory ankyrin repeat subunit C-like, partial [Hemiscyllium ocellatum]|uniref:serine/threonine-protein phosphatase 6 regulatory ankyrin repeat subunit C-like n=1 Tax=Hemiscyllium ocellatum TaxID=170820 RepID=UPI0029665A35
CLEYLLDTGVDPTIQDVHGYSAIHYAAAHGSRQNLELLIDSTFDSLNDGENAASASPLHLAAYNGQPEAVSVLVGTLVNLDVRDQAGRTPLYVAVQQGHTDCVDILTRHGASALVKERLTKGTSLHIAAANGCADCLHLIADSVADAEVFDTMDAQGQTPLMLAVTSGHLDCARLLLERGAQVDTADKRGCTALHRAAALGCADMVTTLLDHRAMVLCRDTEGRTPLHLAAACGHAGILGTLLQAVPSVDPRDQLRDDHGFTPLHWASYKGHEDCLELLLEHKSLNLERDTFSPLHCAVINGHDGAAELLIDILGAKIVNTNDAKGRTPLHAAAFSNNVLCVHLLLEHHAQVNATDRSGHTPLMMAAEHGHTKIVEVLLHRASADLTLHDANKNTALHLACSKGHEMSALLILGEICDPGLINATNGALQ